MAMTTSSSISVNAVLGRNGAIENGSATVSVAALGVPPRASAARETD